MIPIFEGYISPETNLFSFAFFSDRGKREEQQDRMGIVADGERCLAVVCDGIGGIEGGQDAARKVVHLLIEKYKSYFNSGNKEVDTNWLKCSIEEIDSKLFEERRSKNLSIGGGSTVSAVCISGNGLLWISVGDSRIYFIRNKKAVRVTTDHVQGRFEELLAESDKGIGDEVLSSYMGMGGLGFIDLNERPFKLKEKDRLVLCTDGAYKPFDDSEFERLIERYEEPDYLKEQLERQIRSRSIPNQDNYSFIILKVEKV